VRRAAKVDGNHADVVKALREAHVAVRSIAPMGKGYPDLMCSVHRYMCLVEVKQPGEQLNAAQVKFRDGWPGDIHVVTSPEQAVQAVIEGARSYFMRSGGRLEDLKEG
jgi:hypothetical protein